MTAVVGENEILLLQLTRESDGRKFLSHTGMNGAVQFAL
jgi:hypothetical protein